MDWVLFYLKTFMSFFGLGFVVVQLVNARALFQCVLLVFVGIFSFWFWAHWRTAFTAAVRGFWVLDPAASEVNIRGEYVLQLCSTAHRSLFFSLHTNVKIHLF